MLMGELHDRTGEVANLQQELMASGEEVRPGRRALCSQRLPGG